MTEWQKAVVEIDVEHLNEFTEPLDIQTFPRYRERLDLERDPLAKLIGFYRFYMPCGRASCPSHRLHHQGYVFRTRDEWVTTLGYQCGHLLIGEDFQVVVNKIEHRVKLTEYLEVIKATVEMAPAIRERLQELMQGPRGFSWAQGNRKAFFRTAPQGLLDNLRQRAAKGGHIIHQYVELTGRERALRTVMSSTSTRLEQPDREEWVERRAVGALRGLVILQDSPLWRIDSTILELLRWLEQIGPETIPHGERRGYAKRCDAIDGQLREAVAMLLSARAFFTRENFNQFEKLVLDYQTQHKLHQMRWSCDLDT